MSQPLTESSIERLLGHRKDEIRSLYDQNPSYRKTFTFVDPHRCSYCARIVLDGCAYKSGVELFGLNTSLVEAIEASKNGCHFFRLLVDICAASFGPQSGLDFSYLDAQLQFEIPSLPPTPSVSWLISVLLAHPGSNRRYMNEYYYTGGLFLCAKKDNPAATCVWTRPHESDPQSQIVAEFATARLRECMTTHDTCRLDSSQPCSEPEILEREDLPTRLLEISEPTTRQIRLIELASLPSEDLDRIARDGFVTLSYCWGGDQPVKLVKDTAQTLKNGVATNSLPQTLQDAINYTSILGMKYIWIDALCITQDDDYEKGLEIARLPSYYNRNTATICAASAQGCTTGFLGECRPEFRAGPFEIAMQTPEGMGSVLIYDTLPPDQPTTSRAWTLQESLLSRRLLIFSSDRLVWCCRDANSGCGGPDATMTPRNMGMPQSLVSEIYPLSVPESHPARKQWDKVVQNYTRRKLTNATDKLLAVAAAASTLHTMSRIREAQNSIYLAGLLIITDNVEFTSEALSWLTVHPTARRIPVYTAPSWSWACMDGEIASEPGYSRLDSESSFPGFEKAIHRFNIIEYGVTPVVAVAPYGAVSSGFLKIRGPVWLLESIRNVPVVVIETMMDSSRHRLSPGECSLTVFPDTKADKELIGDWVRTKKSELFLLELKFVHAKYGVKSLGLILSLCKDRQNIFTRVGAFRYETNEKPDDDVVKNMLQSLHSEREVTLI